MVNGFCQSTIVVDGFSMVFLHVNHWCQWFFNGFSDFNHWYQWFFQCFFPIQPLPLNEWFCGSPLTLMVFQWFWEKLKLVHKKGQKNCQAIFEGLDFPNSRTATRENCGNRDCFIGPSFLQSYSSCVNSWIVYSETRQIGPLFQIDMPL